jgi:YD repeat-containing protein
MLARWMGGLGVGPRLALARLLATWAACARGLVVSVLLTLVASLVACGRASSEPAILRESRGEALAVERDAPPLLEPWSVLEVPPEPVLRSGPEAPGQASCPSCDDGNSCTLDACVGGQCVHTPRPLGASCGGVCEGRGQCVGAGSSAVCSSAPYAAGTSCGDGDACNGAETCDGQKRCVAGGPPVLDDHNPCTTDTCDPALGVLHTPLPRGAPCSDGDACNGAETCSGAGAQCLSGAPPVVDDGNPCTADWCEPTLGVTHAPLPMGLSCSDGNLCNGDERCSAGGLCLPGAPPAAGTSCVLGACGGACAGGWCLVEGGSCSDGEPCTTGDTCDPHGQCVGTPAPVGTSCSDGDLCNGDEACDGAGECEAAVAPAVDDDDPSTVDACFSDLGVVHAACADTDSTGLTPLAVRAACLYLGPSPVQVELLDAAGAPLGTLPAELDPLGPDAVLAPSRVSLVHGLARDEGGPLAGVEVRVAGEPRWGRTVTRADGRFDLAVEGGGTLRVAYSRAGYLRSERHLVVPALADVEAEPVELVPLDPEVGTYVPDDGALQVVTGSVVSDDRGPRQATLFLPGHTDVSATLPDGSVVPLGGALHVRATEFTVGPQGLERMPGTLPPTTHYTYAVELTIDEAEALGAARVDFSRPVHLAFEALYHPHLPVGTAVPVGYYDREDGAWHPTLDGRIVALVGVDAAGRALVDATGDGVADDALGLDDALGVALAARYSVGTALWLMRLEHFTPYDCNFPWRPPANAGPPGNEPEVAGDTRRSNTACGSIIDCENRSLREVIPVTGAPHALVYASDRVPGRVPRIALPAPSTSADYMVTIEVAGQHHHWFCPLETGNCLYSSSSTGEGGQQDGRAIDFTWDRRDHLGRWVRGAVEATVRWSFRYPCLVAAGGPGDASSWGTMSFGQPGSLPMEVPPASSGQKGCHFTFPREARYLFDSFDAGAAFELGGWSLTGLYAYDAQSGVLFSGDGTAETLGAMGYGLEHRAGNGDSNGWPASTPKGSSFVAGGIAVARDGRVLAANSGLVTAFDPTSESIEVLTSALSGLQRVAERADGVVLLATQQDIFALGHLGVPTLLHGGASPQGLATFADGAYAYATPTSVVRVDPSGVASVLAGGVSSGECNPLAATPVLATSVMLCTVSGLAAGPDGSVYVIAGGGSVVYRVTPDGLMRLVLKSAPSVDAAAVALTNDALQFGVTRAVAVGPTGELYALAGGTGSALSPALFRIDSPNGVGGPGTALRLALHASGCDDNAPECGVGGYALSASIYAPSLVGLAVGPDGLVHLALQGKYYTVGRSFPFLGPDELVVPSADATQAFVFDPHGRHQRTLDAFTGETTLTITRDLEGRPVSLVDRWGDVTTIVRDASGAPTAIVAPHGETTTLTTSLGWLTSVTSPDGLAHQLTYELAPLGVPNGLLATFTDPRGAQSSFTWSADGRLLADTDGLGGTTSLLMSHTTGSLDGFEVELWRVLDDGERRVRHGVERGPSGEVRETLAREGGVWKPVARLAHTPDGWIERSLLDGTTLRARQTADPRFGLTSPYTAEEVLDLGSGRTLHARRNRAVSTTPGHPLEVQQLTETWTANDRSVVAMLDRVSVPARSVLTTPAGRRTETELDEHLRPTRHYPATLVAGGAGLTLHPTELEHHESGVDVGRLHRVVTGARETSFVYDAFGRVSEVHGPEGTVTTLTYDAAHRPVSHTRGGLTVEQVYDAAGDLAIVRTPAGHEHGFERDVLGRVTSRTWPSVAGEVDAVEHYEHERDHSLVRVTRPDQSQLVSSYDEQGRLAGVTPVPSAPDDELSFVFEPFGELGESPTEAGRLLSAARGQVDPVTLSFVWDHTRPVSETVTLGGDVVGVVSQHYDGEGSPVCEALGSGLLAGAGVYTVRELDGLTTRVARVGMCSATAPAPSSSDVVLGRDDGLGRVVAEHEQRSAGGQTSELRREHGYDAAGRLSWVDWGPGPCALEACEPLASATWDADGNRVGYELLGEASEATFDARARLRTSTVVSVESSPDRDAELRPERRGGRASGARGHAHLRVGLVWPPDGGDPAERRHRVVSARRPGPQGRGDARRGRGAHHAQVPLHERRPARGRARRAGRGARALRVREPAPRARPRREGRLDLPAGGRRARQRARGGRRGERRGGARARVRTVRRGAVRLGAWVSGVWVRRGPLRAGHGAGTSRSARVPRTTREVAEPRPHRARGRRYQPIRLRARRSRGAHRPPGPAGQQPCHGLGHPTAELPELHRASSAHRLGVCRDRGDGLAMLSNDATVEKGLRLYRSGTCQLGAGIVDAMAIPAAVGMAVGGVSGAVSGPSLVRVNLIRANRVPTTRNGSLAGRNHPKTGVPFDKEGFPDFSAFRHPDYPDVRIELSGSRAQDFARANAASGLKSTPPKYTWHHHQDPGLNLLIERYTRRQATRAGSQSRNSRYGDEYGVLRRRRLL